MSKKCKTCWELTKPPHLNKYCSPKCVPQGIWNLWGNPKPIKRVSDKKIKRLEEYGWEMELFYKKIDKVIQEKWQIRCSNPYCEKLLDKNSLWPASFAHILSKWQFPALRYFLNNIAIVCNDISINSCHTQLDSLVTWNKRQIEQDILNWKEIDFNLYKK